MVKRSAESRFSDFLLHANEKIPELPLVHISDGYHLLDILQPGVIRATPCKVFDRDILYMFYGKPAYRTKHNGNAFLSCHLPCAFIFKTDNISERIKSVFPFDTGAFHNNFYKSFFHNSSLITDFLLPPSIESAKRVVSTFYCSNHEYYCGSSRKNVDIPLLNFEAEGYHELSRAPAHPDANSKFSPDERASAIEVHFHEDVDLADRLLGCVLPVTFLDDETVKENLDKLNPEIIKTYSTINKHTSEAIAGKLYEIVEEIYKAKGIV
ncbi:hypothetical protein GB927_005070 [Shinella sp. CPCC 100929]|uniref:Uncharacterized protein n=1 Tax=Shinella lacus TaxID=2654216 RepID=A0ABT1R2J8_9HYPH|nr:hypothetical protein [Shinella lacus]MCQ4629397.1 hypothetical protein [Shinella lacus]